MESLLIPTKPSPISSSVDWTNISAAAKVNFLVFLYGIFSHAVTKVDEEFCGGDHIEEWAYRLQHYRNTATVSARYHVKTTTMLAKIAWQLYRAEKAYTEWLFIGYTQDLAEHHLKRLKRYIAALPDFFSDCLSLTSAESILHYRKGNYEFICEPEGIQSFKRGRHPDGIICDDILRDPEVKLDISQLKKIEDIFIEQIMQMPKEELHVVGTPQDREDLFARLETMPSFDCRTYSAEVNRVKKIALWPEVWSWERLQQKKADIRERAYGKEFLCHPVRSEEGYFTYEELDSVVEAHYREYGQRRPGKFNGYTYGGLDIGKKRHPSHLSVFAENRKKRLVQIVSLWMDSTDYTRQLEICQEYINIFKMQRLHYDDTRAEMEGFKERGELPAEMKGINFTKKKKFEMAAQLEKKVKKNGIALLKDGRQRRQMLNVDNDLKSMQTNEGHGDSFWSNALAMDAAKGTRANITIL